MDRKEYFKFIFNNCNLFQNSKNKTHSKCKSSPSTFDLLNSSLVGGAGKTFRKYKIQLTPWCLEKAFNTDCLVLRASCISLQYVRQLCEPS